MITQSRTYSPAGQHPEEERQREGRGHFRIRPGGKPPGSPRKAIRVSGSYELGKGLFAIDIHNVKDPQLGTDVQGRNPLDYWSIKKDGHDVPFTRLYKTYDWVRDNGYANMPSWIEAAAKAAGR